ncbi:cilia- and flagella-associated protein 91-like isoform X1 [Acropora millepora]|uniref:cilia- and flagella-associated protein 91-like isoform X1 n=1 Tax=Acropora millepora TaxID=45264 RepID=UPI001CF54C6F|nr:cilia- and flagella-associated protein 91-like isoform X1 [Acropora millepora]XP_044167946.1 cilia- and flagella-associated protein 91-like isoform X1 [Acropora millepora]
MENLELRKRMMDEQDRREWAFREQEIEKLQEARLEVLKRILEQREEDHAELNAKRLDRLWSKKQQEKERKFNRIQTEHIKRNFEITLTNLLNTHAPIKKRAITLRPYAPWYNDSIDVEKRKRRKLERRWRKSSLNTDRQLCITQCGIVNDKRCKIYLLLFYHC